MGKMSISDLKMLYGKLTNKKREYKRQLVVKRQVEQLQTDKEIRKRVNDHILKDMLEKTRSNNNPEIRNLHSRLTAHQNLLI